MNLLTHIALGYIIAASLGYTVCDDVFWAIVFCATIPDADVFVSNYLFRKVRHRGIFHSLFVVPIFALLPSLILATSFYQFVKISLICTLSLLTHLLTDILSPRHLEPMFDDIPVLAHQGVLLFFPFSKMVLNYTVSNKSFRMINVLIFVFGFLLWIKRVFYS